MSEIEVQLWKSPENLHDETRILSASDAVVTALHITKFHILTALDSGVLYIFSHKDGRDIGKELVVRIRERGIWCVGSWEGSEGDEREEWIVVGGTGSEDNLAIWGWNERGRFPNLSHMIASEPCELIFCP
ncbi:hypothetical protein EYC80_007434 [Monilinia laxa]|uniref:Uncharacterized protein n=1 Tax=Monilinia laxa TaxID=61186 RepID=A0A5N6JV48_MONLA|nr:hypothetical protein EYC80_007434 [Monilinia laxa]